MKSFLFAFICLIGLNGCFDDEVHRLRHCGSPCITFLDGKTLLDKAATDYTCEPGILVCSDDDTEFCDGGRIPSTKEICDAEGIDNDCNSNTPDYFLFREPWNDLNHCSETEQGVCREATSFCRNGEYVCISDLKKDYETCSGLDEDCDGLYDEEDPDLKYEGDPFYYPEDIIETANVGQCQIGVRRCVDSQEVIVGLVTPTEEVCDVYRADEDCDGFNNEDETHGGNSFLLVVDHSGSMLTENLILLDTLCAWAGDPMFDASWFAVMAIGKGSASTRGSVQVSDFASAGEACRNAIDFNIVGAQTEYITRGILTGFGADYNWPEGLRKHVLFFTDEDPDESLFGDPLLTDREELALLCSQQEFDLGGFVFDAFEDLWQSEIDSCGGWIESVRVSNWSDAELARSRIRLEAALERRFVPTCD